MNECVSRCASRVLSGEMKTAAAMRDEVARVSIRHRDRRRRRRIDGSRVTKIETPSL
jgi:hypothetical protein